MSNVHGLTLDGSTVLFTPTASSTSNSQAIRIWGSSDIVITNAVVTGGPSVNGVEPSATTLDSTGNVLGQPVGKAINIDNSSNITINATEISQFHKGITFSNSSDLTISSNDIHDLRTTPISGSVISGLVITGNHTWDSNPWNFGGSGDHGDRIHIWTGTTTITGLVISDNVLEQGSGAPMLGIYLDDNGKGLGFSDVVVSGNTLVDGESQGVLLENVSGLIAGNTLTWSGSGTAYNDTPRFNIKAGSHDLKFMDNWGPVSIDAGVQDITIVRQGGAGTIALDAGLTMAALDTIHIDTQVTTGRNSYELAGGVLDLTFAGTGDFTGGGNALANRIIGGSGNDVLTGNGGADSLEGRAGNDIYVVDNATQTIVDSSGIDTVVSAIGWQLQVGLENLTYTGTAGATLTGNTSSNQIIGGRGNDTLIANGGRDLLDGGAGDDTYVLDNSGHTIVDASGIDTVVTSLGHVLQAGLENLTLTGASNINATGNASANVLTGNAGNNTLDGGSGADLMTGGAGNDLYIIDDAGDRAVEAVTDGGVDTVRTSLGGFTLDNGFENLVFTGGGQHSGTGNAAANTLTGSTGTDVLAGGGGNDLLNGGAGNDVLDGGLGLDILTGSSGNDSFVFSKGEADGDSITDFYGYGAAVGDTVRFVGYGAGSTLTATGMANVWQITDGVDQQVEFITVSGSIYPTDILFG